MLVEIEKLMVGLYSEDEIELNPRVRCAFGNVFYKTQLKSISCWSISHACRIKALQLQWAAYRLWSLGGCI